MATGEGEDGDHKDEEDIFPFGMDPSDSLNFLSLREMSRRGMLQPQTSIDEEGSQESAEEELEPAEDYGQDSVDYGGEVGLGDSLRDYAYGLPGTTPPKQCLVREKRRSKQKASGGGKHLSQEARLLYQPKRNEASLGSSSTKLTHDRRRGSNNAMTVGTASGESPTHLSKKQLRKLTRTKSPPQTYVTEEPKPNKKHQTIQRHKDRDEKSGYLQPKSNPPSSSSITDISRSLSEEIVGTSDTKDRVDVSSSAADFVDSYLALPPLSNNSKPHLNLHRRGSNHDEMLFDGAGDVSVTASLNPSQFRRGSGGVNSRATPDLARPKVRRTNSDAQFFPTSSMPPERRCPHERKQFYRQFIKNLKYHGIHNAVTSRMEQQSGNIRMQKFQSHSVNFGASTPVDPRSETLWLEIRSKLKNCHPHEGYKEWLFFQQSDVDAVLRKILHFSVNEHGREDSSSSGPASGVESDAMLQRTASSPVLQKKVGQATQRDRGKPVISGLVSVHKQASLEERKGEDKFNGSVGEDTPDYIHDQHQRVAPVDDNFTEADQDNPEDSLSGSLASSFYGVSEDMRSSCKVHHQDYLSEVQREALAAVTKLLEELDTVESLYMNRKRMGAKHHMYHTLFFKRRMCALILWQKVTYGLAENLCRLSSWLGAEILLPEVCKDPPPVAPMLSSFPTSPSSASRASMNLPTTSSSTLLGSHQSSSTSLTATSLRHNQSGSSGTVNTNVGVAPSSRVGSVSPSPLSSSYRARFSVGSPVEEEEEEVEDFMSLESAGEMTVQGASVSSSQSDVTVQQRRMRHQVSILEPYREFVSRSLKRTGLSKTTKRLKEFMTSVLTISKYAMGTPSEEDCRYLYMEEQSEEEKPLHRFIDPQLLRRLDDQTHEISPNLFERSMSVDAQDWMQEFKSMGLPGFTVQYVQLLHVPLDVMQECLQLQSELGEELSDPSSHSVKQLADECREILEHAIEVRNFYRENMNVVLQAQPQKAEQVEADMEAFETDMKNVLKVYFQYLKKWATLSSGHVLEEEWRKVKTICTNIRGGEAEAGRKFCDMVTQLLSNMGDVLDVKMDDYINLSHSNIDLEMERDQLMQSCRDFKELFVDVREHVNKILGFAKILRKDLEIAADFKVEASISDFFSVLRSSDHVRVVVAQQRLDKMIFVPESIVDQDNCYHEIQQLLKVSFAHGSSQDSSFAMKDSYILLFNINPLISQSAWTGQTVEIIASAETTINLLELQVDDLKMVVSNSSQLTDCRNSFMRAVNRSVLLSNERTSSHENVADRINDLKVAACDLAKRLMDTASKVMDYLDIENISTADDNISSYRSTMHSCFNLGFEYVREVFRLIGDDMAYRELGDQALKYIIVWIQQFVLSKCERGRGTRPRWASLGLEFIVLACAPTTLASISQTKFENVKKLMNRCIDHVVGEAPTLPSIKDFSKAKSQKSSKWFERNPKLLPTYALGHSYTGMLNMTDEDDEEEFSSKFKLPEFGRRKPQARQRPPSPRGPVYLNSPDPIMVAGTQDTSMFIPSRSPSASAADKDEADIGKAAAINGNGVKTSTPSRSVSFHETQKSGSSPPTSTESLPEKEYFSSSGVDSSPAPSLSDITTTPTPYHPQRSTSTPVPLTPATPVNRSDSVLSSVSSTASRYYTQISSQFSTQSSSSSGCTGSPSLPPCFEKENDCDTASARNVDRIDVIRMTIQAMEEERQQKLIASNQVGRVRKTRLSSSEKGAKLKKLRQANFKWQLGRKIGQGSFGKVFECLNRTTGEMNAVKQVSLLDKDSKDIETIIDEIENFQKLSSEYIVKFHGAEVHHNELYMFMEFCNEGTLWTIAQQGLTEQMIRHYTRDILKAVDAMHTRDMVHRDIKGANIFLSSNGSIKLGDFGLSVQLQNFKNTNAKEIIKQAGTIPYMSPEIILNRKLGKPMDIWAVGCVLIEMATGKLPWSEYKEPFAIMYQLGKGERPPIPSSALSKEGHRFLNKCHTIEVDSRPTAIDLSNDPFVKVSD